MVIDDPPLSPRDAAAHLGISRRSFDRSVKPKLPPAKYPVPRRPKWRRSVIEAYRQATIPAQAQSRSGKKLSPKVREGGSDFDDWFADIHGAKKGKGA